jgi:hypothetical protein
VAAALAWPPSVALEATAGRWFEAPLLVHRPPRGRTGWRSGERTAKERRSAMSPLDCRGSSAGMPSEPTLIKAWPRMQSRCQG